MSHSSHSMSGMTGSTIGKEIAIRNAHSFWYIVASAVCFMAIIRVINYLIARQRLRACGKSTVAHPARPLNRFAEIWAVTTAVLREISNPQLHVSIRGFAWLSPPPLGSVLLLLAYWAVIVYMMVGDRAVVHDVYFWERIGFRNAWVTVMQMPLIYLLAGKANLIGWVAGTSHERLNWLHRWVARTMLVTATVHGFHFWTEWDIAGFVAYQMEILPSTKYGLGAWAVLVWIVASSVYPLRHWAYELFVIQHILSVVVLIWLVYVHVPVEAAWYVWFSVGIICFDRAVRWASMLWYNLRFMPTVRFRRATGVSFPPWPSFILPEKSACLGNRRLGHQALVHVEGDSTVVTVKDVHFSWQAGQHLYLWIPRLGPLEAHPYTISSAHRIHGKCVCNSIQLVIRAHNGFSSRLHRFGARLRDEGKEADLTAFVSMPYGAPPRVDIFETLILISASTGASFTLPILESIVVKDSKAAATCVRRVEFVLLTRRGEEVGCYLGRISDIASRYQQRGIRLRIHVALTGGKKIVPSHDTLSPDAQLSETQRLVQRRSTTPTPTPASLLEKDNCCSQVASAPHRVVDVEKGVAVPDRSISSSRGSTFTHGSEGLIEYDCRPNLEALIREPVETSYGETSVVVCGGLSLTSQVRNIVTSLSDERAVHKGTGAQGIHLHVEEYSF